MYEQRLPIEEWKAKKQAELKETIAAQKSVLQEVVQDGQRLADYLYGRGRLGSHITSGNAALVLQTLPQARAVLTAKDWDKFGRRVNKGAKGIPQLVRVNGYYNVGSIFDVSMTYGNKPYPIPEIKPEQMDKAIKELERLSPVNIIFQNEGVVGYDAEQHVIVFPTAMPQCEVLARLPAEIVIATAEQHTPGISQAPYLRKTAMAVSVEFCGRFSLPMPDTAAATLDGMDTHIPPGEERKTLEEIRELSVTIGDTVEKALGYHANIRKALSDAVKLKLIPYNPAAEVERPKKDNFVASYYSADELMEVLPIFANTKMELPVMLAAFYGLRRSEVIGLQWSAIDFERKIVTISRTFERINVDGKMVDVSKCRTKNKSSFRSLPLIPAVEQALLKAQKRQRQQMKLCGNSYCKEYKDYICVDDMGHLVTPDYVTRVFREMLLKNGFRPIRYHDLRHSCASLLIKNKVTMKEVQMWLGHSSFSTTANIYAHIDVDSKMEAANMIASKINLGELPEKKKSPKRKIA